MKLATIERIAVIAEILRNKDLTREERAKIANAMQDIIGIVDGLEKRGGDLVD